MITMEDLIEQLIKHEGIELRAYTCPAGKISIGIGRNLEDLGISQGEALYLLKNDIRRCAKELSDKLDFFTKLNSVRQQALINMCFNLGISRFMKFKNMIQALREGDYKTAADEALDSRWSQQVGNRSIEIAEQLRGGV